MTQVGTKPDDIVDLLNKFRNSVANSRSLVDEASAFCNHIEDALRSVQYLSGDELRAALKGIPGLETALKIAEDDLAKELKEAQELTEQLPALERMTAFILLQPDVKLRGLVEALNEHLNDAIEHDVTLSMEEFLSAAATRR